MDEYFIVVDVPKNTPESSPITKYIDLEGDYVYEISYLIPPGHLGLTGFQIYYGDLQLLPKNKGEWVRGDNVYRSVRVRWSFRSRRFRLTIKAYNNDDTYDHGFYFWIVTANRNEVMWYERLERIMSYLIRLLWRRI